MTLTRISMHTHTHSHTYSGFWNNRVGVGLGLGNNRETIENNALMASSDQPAHIHTQSNGFHVF